jgi:hypothetical protein
MSINSAFWFGFFVGVVSVILGATGAMSIHYLAVTGG